MCHATFITTNKKKATADNAVAFLCFKKLIFKEIG